MKFVDISLIIPTYNRLNTLIKTLNSLLNCRCIPDDILIIDQSENAINNAYKIIKTFGMQINVRVITLKYPSSTKARNIGMENAINDIIVFSDDDVLYEKDTFKNVYRIMKRKKFALLAGLDRNAELSGSLLPYIFFLKSISKRKIGHISKGVFGRYPDVNNVTKMTKTEWAMGYFFSVKKSLLENWDIKFDEKLGQYAYAEDLDFSYRYIRNAVENRMKAILCPSVIVTHDCSKEWRTSNKRQSYVLVFNRYYLHKKDGIGTLIGFWWSNIGLLIKKIKTRDNPYYHICAMKDCWLYKSDIAKGNMHTYLYKEL